MNSSVLASLSTTAAVIGEAVLDHRLLTLLGQHVLDEFSAQRIQRLVRILVQVDVEETGERIFAPIGVLRRRLNAVTLFLSERNRADIGRLVANARIANRELVAGDALNDR